MKLCRDCSYAKLWEGSYPKTSAVIVTGCTNEEITADEKGSHVEGHWPDCRYWRRRFG
jgi:hypothetical protein